MNRFFVTSDQIAGDILTVTGPDAHHIVHVLRLKKGDDFEAADETGLVHTCRIEREETDEITARVLFSEPGQSELPNRIVLFMGLPRFEKMELIIQKAVELGVASVVPVVTARTVVRFDDKKAAAKRARWQTIAEAAAKQSKRTVVPDVLPVMSFEEAVRYATGTLDKVFIPYEKAKDSGLSRERISLVKKGESLGIFIGPEGGFEEEEAAYARTNGAEFLTLGPRVLRCETAAIATLSILMFHLTT